MLARRVDAHLAAVDRLFLGHRRIERQSGALLPDRVIAIRLHARGDMPLHVVVVVDVAVVFDHDHLLGAVRIGRPAAAEHRFSVRRELRFDLDDNMRLARRRMHIDIDNTRNSALA